MLSDLDYVIAGLRETLDPGFDHLQTEGTMVRAHVKKSKTSNKRVKVFRRLTALRQLLQSLKASNEPSLSMNPSLTLVENDTFPTETEVDGFQAEESVLQLPDIGSPAQIETPFSYQQMGLQADANNDNEEDLGDHDNIKKSTNQVGLLSNLYFPCGNSDADVQWAALRSAVKQEVQKYISSSPSSSSLSYSSSVDCRLRVAYFPDPIKSEVELANGSPQSYAQSIATTLRQTGIDLQAVDSDDIRNGKLTKKNFDMVIVPGGYVSNYSKALGKDGKQAIIDFVKQGGGYVGICAGAYLGTSCASRKKRTGGLGLLPDVSVMDYEHWARGRSDDCVLKLQDAGVDTLCGSLNKPTYLKSGEHIITRYCNGPLLSITPKVTGRLQKDGMFPPLSSPQTIPSASSYLSPKYDDLYSGQEISSSESVATFVSDFTNLAIFGKKIIKPTGFKELPRGIMNKTHAIVRGYSGLGKVVLISPHLEDGEPLARQLLRASVRWSAGISSSLSERAFIDIDQRIRWKVRESFLCCRIPKHPECQTDEDKAQALVTLLPANRIIPRPLR